jgi:predicted MPP superfamily phosphohydrolase
MPFLTRIIVFSSIALLIDWYFYQAILTVFKNNTASQKVLIANIYWSITVITFLFFIIPGVVPSFHWPKYFRVYCLGVLGMLFFSKVIGSMFIVMDDIIRLFRWVASYLNSSTPLTPYNNHSITRLVFLNKIAVGMAAVPFLAFIYGMVKGAFDYKIHKVKVTLPNLPEAFNGFKILQISDIHSGSFVSAEPLKHAVKLINEQNADIVFFTGDLVNDRASEMEIHMEALSGIKAPMGVYSTLGNHDYGDYAKWDSIEEKRKNLESLKNIHAQLGWKLMMNEHVGLKRGDAEIALIGIENWGANLNFPKYGDMKKAYAGAEKYPVKLLLSHDPSHWNTQVKEEYRDIDITFSGHTHGFQFGIEIPGFRWSPSQYIYKQWAGLYKQGKQYVYVNRGLGFLGYPGRVGIMPEITVMELVKG